MFGFKITYFDFELAEFVKYILVISK